MKTRNKRQFQIYFFVAGSLLIIFILVIGNYLAFNFFKGGGDFIAQWKGIQLVLQSGISPYSSQAETLISNASSQADSSILENDYGFKSALFSLIFYTPLALIQDTRFAFAMWATLSELSLGLILFLFVRKFKIKSTMLISILMVVFIYLSLPTFQAIISGSSAILVCLLIFAGAIYLASGREEIAGILAAGSMIRADLVLLVVLFLIAWSIKSRRWTFPLWFSGTLVLLIGFSMLFIPDWLISYSIEWTRTAIRQYELHSVIQNRLFIVTIIVFFILLIVEWLISTKISQKRILWLVVITLVISLLLNRQVRASEFVLLIPGILFGLFLIRDRWRNQTNIVTYILLTLFFALLWLTSPVLFSNISTLVTTWVLHGLYPVLVLILLYWSRWWVIQEASLPEGMHHLRGR